MEALGRSEGSLSSGDESKALGKSGKRRRGERPVSNVNWAQLWKGPMSDLDIILYVNGDLLDIFE